MQQLIGAGLMALGAWFIIDGEKEKIRRSKKKVLTPGMEPAKEDVTLSTIVPENPANHEESENPDKGEKE